MKRLLIIGYGQMGKMIEELAEDQGFEVVGIIDPKLGKALNKKNIGDSEIAIEFTQPSMAVDNIKICLELGLKVVCGTTGWYENLREVTGLVERYNGALVYGSNFSPGMNIFYEIVAYASRQINAVSGYDAYGYELHHRYKKDSPSGTAKKLGNLLLENLKNKSNLVYDKLDRQKTDKEIHFASVRAGEIAGEHRIGFDSEYDTIELKHSARNRRGLAIGALMAANWIADKKGIHEFSSVIKS